jgi:tetrahydromethanopterin S-methyltransferase subunit B
LGGFFLDIFSGWPIGVWISALLITSLFIKKILKNYVRIPLVVRT